MKKKTKPSTVNSSASENRELSTGVACPFCAKIEDQRVLDESDLSVVFLSNPSMTRGHTLVVPKRHVWKPWDVTDKEYADLIRLTNKYRQKLEAVVGPGSDIRQQYRPFLPDGPVHNLRHFHIHILPRQAFDNIYDAEEHIANELHDDDAKELVRLLA